MAILDPVAAYDRIAPIYESLAEQRRAYIEAVDRIAIAETPHGSRSLLDVGAGLGDRAGRIARATGIREFVLLEPSAAMRSHCPETATLWPMRAEELHTRDGSFDVILCLWNVLGHISSNGRVEVLRQMRRLASGRGKIFIDVNHRYNARHYGALKTAMRYVRDRVAPGPGNGDVTVSWPVDGDRCLTTGHVFTAREFGALAGAAGLSVERRVVIDYATGELRRRSFEGNFLYVLRRSLPPASGTPHESGRP